MSLEKFIQQNRQAFEQEPPPARVWGRIVTSLDQELSPDRQNKRLPLGEDDLETFVRSQQADFEASMPPLFVERAIFDRLDQYTNSQKDTSASVLAAVKGMRHWVLRVAAVLLLIGSGWWVGRNIGYPDARKEQLAAILNVHPDFLEVEAYYQQQIAEMSQVVYEKNPDPRLAADLAEMDQAMEELRQELPLVPPAQQAATVADLIKTYRIKLQILQNILALLPDEKGEDTKPRSYENDEI